ncbi:erythromycin esterase family protein [Flavobacterium sp.]|jgi:erythromycin esterase-like protein|uniref:erythromycin esterase family protein n=1 Tax=Flavobacterium sp. TaxID=239 RepID=UPI0037BF4440
MKTFYIKNDPHQNSEIIDLSKLILENSIELINEKSLDELVEQIGDAKYVLLGEASHGTHEYYVLRAQISKLLIEKKGFSFIAVEGDWPDCYRLNRYIKNYPDSGKTAEEVLHSFNRWPTWMWANWETVALAEWLREFNERQTKNNKIGFYGLDVYSLWESFESIIEYLDKKDPKTKQEAIQAFKCFEPYNRGEGQEYARASRMVPSLCENEVVDLLSKIRLKAPSYNTDPEAVMSVEQNAQVIVNAERYYRAMIKSGADSWNIRDRHMIYTLDNLIKFHGPQAKGIIWEHNTHIGDARATDMAAEGMINVGQILNELHRDEGVYSVGFGSYQGTVIAAREWGDVMQIMKVPEAAKHSWEYELHRLNAKDRIVFMNQNVKADIGDKKLGHRAIGVVYHPKYEYLGNYVPSEMPYRYNAFIYVDETSALHPLHLKSDVRQLPETYPFGV